MSNNETETLLRASFEQPVKTTFHASWSVCTVSDVAFLQSVESAPGRVIGRCIIHIRLESLLHFCVVDVDLAGFACTRYIRLVQCHLSSQIS